jgi:hypothetical protein
MERVEEFTSEGKNFMYIDMSEIKEDKDFIKLMELTETLIAKYPEHSLYIIGNIENVRFDSRTAELTAEYLKKNEPYIKFTAMIGVDGIKKIMFSQIFKKIGRKNLLFAFTKEKAIELLSQQEV